MALTRFPLETDQPKIKVTLPPGRHVLELVVEDSAGLRSKPDTVIITVHEELPLPEIEGISPASGIAGRSVRAEIKGSHLKGATSVRFEGDGVTARILSSTDPEQLEVQVDIAADATPGTRGFTVTVPAGTTHSPEGAGFTVETAVEPSRITGIEPSRGMVGTTVNAVITGTNLLGAQKVIFSGAGVTARISGRVSLTKVPVSINIGSRAKPGRRSFTVITSAGKIMSPGDVVFNVSGIVVVPPGEFRLNMVEGIGPVYAERLTGAGITTASALAEAEPSAVANAIGISKERAVVLINNARRRLEG